VLEACLVLVLHHRLDFQGGGGTGEGVERRGEERRGWWIQREAVREVSIIIRSIDLTCKSMPTACRHGLAGRP
jgi:hypothetical protein